MQCQLEPVLCFDTSALDGRIFAKSAPWRASKTQLCRIAGVQDPNLVSVYAFGSPHPIGPGEFIDVEPFGCVFFSHPEAPARIGHLLSTMLLTSYCWTLNAALPAPVHARRFCCVLDRGPRLLTWPANRPGRQYVEVVSELFELDAAAVTVQPTRPLLEDVALDGFSCVSAVAVTDAISRLPVPPGRLLPVRSAFVVDARPLLLGLILAHADDGRVSVSDLVRSLSDFAPDGFYVQLEGAPTDDTGGFLLVHPGHVVVATYVSAGTSDDASSEADTSPGHGPDVDPDDGSDGGGTPRRLFPSPRDSPTEDRRARSRSRSPPGQAPTAGARAPTATWCYCADFKLAVRLCVPQLSCKLWNSAEIAVHPWPAEPLADGVTFALQLAPCSSKLLTEPLCRAQADHFTLRALRRTAARLHEPWPFSLHPGSVDEVFTSEPTGSDTDSFLHPRTEWATFAVLVPAYSPELLTIALSFPATFDDARRAMQDARAPEAVLCFPHLLPITPQLFDDLAICIATPSWLEHANFICLDLLEVDGRLFAASSPPRMQLQDLLALAALPADAPVDVFVGPESLPLQPGIDTNVTPGITITFVPEGGHPMHNLSIHEMLLDHRYWSADAVLPEPVQPGSYCLVREHGHALRIAAEAGSTSLRLHVAAALDLDVTTMRLFPAMPRPGNVELNGYYCHAVIAAVAGVADGQHDVYVVVDCRSLLLGWRAVAAPAGWLDVPALSRQLAARTRVVVDVTFLEIPLGTNLFQVTAGQVLTAVGASSTDVPVLPSGSLDSSVSGSAASVPPPPGGADAPGIPEPVSAIASLEPPGLAAASTEAYYEALVFVLAPEYLPERLTLRLAASQSAADVLLHLAAARSPAMSQRFPSLYGVQLQPFEGYALVLAAPLWRAAGAFVCFDCQQFDGRVFAVEVPLQISRQELLEIALLPRDSDAIVYAAELPGPVEEGQVVSLYDGALVQILPVQHQYFVVAPFADLFSPDTRWRPEAMFPGDYRDHAWVLSDSGAFKFLVRRGRRHLLRHDLAARLATDVDALSLSVATPGILDHMHKGFYTKALMVATVVPAGHRRIAPAPTVFLDLRALLLGFTWRYAPLGVLAHRPLLGQFISRCPPSHVLGFSLRHEAPSPLVRDLRVEHGDVVQIELLPRTQLSLDLAAPYIPRRPPPSPPDFGPGAGTGAASLGTPTWGPQGGEASSVSGVLPQEPLGPAETCGGHNASFQASSADKTALARLHAILVNSRVVMWLQVSLHRASALGSLGVTSVLLLAALRLLCWTERSFDTFSTQHCTAALLLCQCTRRGGHNRLVPLCLLFTFMQITGVLAAQDYAVSAPPGSPSLCCRASATVAGPPGLPRPLPTPCRGAGAEAIGTAAAGVSLSGTPPAGLGFVLGLPVVGETLDDDAVWADDWLGPTLLQEALCLPDCQAYMLASTLLETLFDHFAAPVREPSCTPVPPQIITLCDAVPLTTHQAASLSLAQLLPHTTGPDPLAAGQDWLDADLGPILQDPQVPAALRKRFAAFPSWHDAQCPSPCSLSIFTDGSAKGDRSPVHDVRPCSWAFSAWANCGDLTYLIGFAKGQAVPCHTPFHLLEQDDTALTGEFLGLAWSLAWVAEFGSRICNRASFYYDAVSAGHGVFGIAAIPRTDTYHALAHFCTCLRQYVQTLVDLDHFHVAAHQGQIQNEFVDQLAKQARRCDDDPWCRCLPTWPAKLCQHPYVAWAFATTSRHADIPTFLVCIASNVRPAACSALVKTLYGPRCMVCSRCICLQALCDSPFQRLR